jgi:hypothetical protein
MVNRGYIATNAGKEDFMDLVRKVAELEGFAGLMDRKTKVLENRLAEVERQLKDLDARLRRLKANS